MYNQRKVAKKTRRNSKFIHGLRLIGRYFGLGWTNEKAFEKKNKSSKKGTGGPGRLSTQGKSRYDDIETGEKENIRKERYLVWLFFFEN
jgi:hypothetical protein